MFVTDCIIESRVCYLDSVSTHLLLISMAYADGVDIISKSEHANQAVERGARRLELAVNSRKNKIHDNWNL